MVLPADARHMQHYHSHDVSQVPVAVKKLKAHVLNNTADLREFLSEANTLRRLKHRSVS